MNHLEHLLSIVGEECNEVGQRCSKAARFGMDEIQPGQSLTNSERILQEFNDLVGAMELLYSKPVQELLNQDQIAQKKASCLEAIQAMENFRVTFYNNRGPNKQV